MSSSYADRLAKAAGKMWLCARVDNVSRARVERVARALVAGGVSDERYGVSTHFQVRLNPTRTHRAIDTMTRDYPSARHVAFEFFEAHLVSPVTFLL